MAARFLRSILTATPARRHQRETAPEPRGRLHPDGQVLQVAASIPSGTPRARDGPEGVDFLPGRLHSFCNGSHQAIEHRCDHRKCQSPSSSPAVFPPSRPMIPDSTQVPPGGRTWLNGLSDAISALARRCQAKAPRAGKRAQTPLAGGTSEWPRKSNPRSRRSSDTKSKILDRAFSSM